MRHPNPINLRAIDHVVIRVTGLDGMIAFCTEVLGCRLERGPGDLGLAQLRAGASLIDLRGDQGQGSSCAAAPSCIASAKVA